jgi:hypothetical protein
MEWLEEQQTSKQAEVDNAIKLTPTELETEVQTQVEARLHKGDTKVQSLRGNKWQICLLVQIVWFFHVIFSQNTLCGFMLKLRF